MMKRLLQTYLPTPEAIQRIRWLAFFKRRLQDPPLWQFHRRSVATAASIGLFVSYIPIPGHTAFAIIAALLLRVNLPVAILLSWFVNPLTFFPLLGIAYSIGAYSLGIPLSDFHMEWALLTTMWPPLLLGCLLCGTTLAILANLGIRLYWRYKIIQAWKNRRRSATPLIPPPLAIPSDPFDLPKSDHASQ